jgi:hypothetical protein
LIPKKLYVETVNAHWRQELENAGVNSPEAH